MRFLPLTRQTKKLPLCLRVFVVQRFLLFAPAYFAGMTGLAQRLPRPEHYSEGVCQWIERIEAPLTYKVPQQVILEIAQDKVRRLAQPLVIDFFKGKGLTAGLITGVSIGKGGHYRGHVVIIRPDVKPWRSVRVIRPGNPHIES